jgi:hypothetical protein
MNLQGWQFVNIIDSSNNNIVSAPNVSKLLSNETGLTPNKESIYV